jgi:hypothetical protein
MMLLLQLPKWMQTHSDTTRSNEIVRYYSGCSYQANLKHPAATPTVVLSRNTIYVGVYRAPVSRIMMGVRGAGRIQSNSRPSHWFVGGAIERDCHA